MNNKTFKVMLDAGHYGKYNRSPAVPEYYESDFTWKYTLLLKSSLEAYRIIVDLTRDNKDIDLPVDKRGTMAQGYDLFISNHSDACDDSSVERVTVFCQIDDGEAHTKESRKVAGILAPIVANVMGVTGGHRIKNRGSDYDRDKDGFKDDYYGVIRAAAFVDCPAVLIEHGFHTNARVARWLMNYENLMLLADAVAEGVAEYLGIELPMLQGDINRDGKIDAKDYILCKRICFGTYIPNAEELKCADIDGDGKVTAKDYVLIKRMCFGTYK